jgi:hypothetical protein
MDGGNKSTIFDWDGFKQKQFAVICETDKEQFFAYCKQHGIHCFLSEFSKKRSLFVCVQLYENRLSNGRYELVALKGWEIKPNGLYGKDGLEVIEYDKTLL